jgi:hypothetical protein
MYIKEKKASTYSCPIPVDEVYNYSDIYIEVKIGNEIKLIYLTNQLIDYFIK